MSLEYLSGILAKVSKKTPRSGDRSEQFCDKLSLQSTYSIENMTLLQ